MPHWAGVDVAGRTLSGEADVPVGGDWYDVLPVGGCHLFFVVGDVAGRGLEAAALMTRLRDAVRRDALDGWQPAAVLAHMADLMEDDADERFATMVCGRLDLVSGELTVANAGHLPLLIVDPTASALLAAPVGPPVGVGRRYATVHTALNPSGATVVAVTDGLVERRDEPIDAGLDRLRRSVRQELPVERLVDELVASMPSPAAHDDIAMLAIRWHGSVQAARVG